MGRATYRSVIQGYVGTATLAPYLSYSGVIVASATDDQAQTVEVASAFSLEAIRHDQDFVVWSSDGQAELHLLAGTLSADGQVGFNQVQAYPAIPEGKVLLSGPYAISAAPELNLTGNASLAFVYLDYGGSFLHANLNSAQIYQEASGNWLPVASTLSPTDPIVAGSISSFGVYAVLADWDTKIFLPLTTRNLQAQLSQPVRDQAENSTPEQTLPATGADSRADADIMVLVPAGELKMGCDSAHNGGFPCETNEQPLHTVYLEAYQIDKYEVTNLKYSQCAAPAIRVPTHGAKARRIAAWQTPGIMPTKLPVPATPPRWAATRRGPALTAPWT